MFFNAGIRGDRLPRGTVCFTYDDGPGRTESPGPAPGPRTAELGAYLRTEEVQAAFFAVGRNAERHQDVLDSLRSDGHLVANHTFDHPSLPAYVSRGGDVVGQIERTDAAIRAHAREPTIYFRPPYGDWRLKGQDRSNVAQALNRSALARDHVGPVLWDVDAGDVGYWRDDRPADECALAYLEAIESAGRGVVLMHDSTADVESIRLRNRALELARLLVPELRRRGYRFVGLDAIPQVVSAARASSLVRLTAIDDLEATVNDGDDRIVCRAPSPGPAGEFGVIEAARGRRALRACNGLYVSARRGGEFHADSLTIGDRETFTIESSSDGRVAWKSHDGALLGFSHR